MNNQKERLLMVFEVLLMVAATTLLSWLSMGDGFFSLSLLFLPVVIAVYSFRRGLVLGSAASGLIVLVTALLSRDSALYLLTVIVPLGLVLGILFNKKKSVRTVILFGLLASFLGISSWYMINTYIFHYPSLFDVFNETVKLYEVPQVWIDAMKDVDPTNVYSMETLFVQAMTNVFPSLLMLFVAAYTLINYWITHGILTRSSFEVEPRISFSKISLPQDFIVGILVIIVLSFITTLINPRIEDILFMTVSILSLAAFSLQGLAVLSFLLHKNGVKGFFQWPILIFITIAFTVIGVGVIGSLDSIFDFRKLKRS